MMNNMKTDLDGGNIDVEMATEAAAAAVECGICLDPVSEDGKRSWAKLQCNHQFHLDCIGSAFNAKGLMECPNCRKVEKGDWLFPNGTTQLRPANPFPQSFLAEWDLNLDIGLPEFPDLSGPYSVSRYSSSLPTFTHFVPGPHNGLSSGASSVVIRRRRRIIRRGGDEQQRATRVSVHHSARSGSSVTRPPATRLPTHPRVQQAQEQRARDLVQALQVYRQQSSNPASTRASYPNRVQQVRERVQALQAYRQQSSNPASTPASIGASESRSNNSQNNNTRNRNLPPIPYSSNNAATNHLQLNSSLGRENYHHREQVLDGHEYYYEPRVVRRQSMRRRRSEFEGSRQFQNQG